MGRLLIILGIVLTIVGIVGPMLGIANIFSSLAPTLSLATDHSAQEAQLCKSGEKLIESEGTSQYEIGVGYAHSVQLYCENSEGQRRDVTGEFANTLIGATFDNVFSGIGQTMLFIGAAILGIILIIIGVIMNVRRRVVMGDANIYINARPIQTSSQAINNLENPLSGQSLTQQLQELENAYQRKLISKEEYERMRQRLLDSMR